MLENHSPIVIEEFNGYYKRGDVDSVPLDHFSEVNNISYIESGFRTRDGLDIFFPQGGIVRIYTYITQFGSPGFLALDVNSDIYHIIPDLMTSTLILHVDDMDDFKICVLNNHVFITPMNVASGLDDFLYIYKGDGTVARKVGGIPPLDADGALAAADTGTGHVEAGFHIYGVVYETDTGFLTQIGPDTLAELNSAGGTSVVLTNIPVSPNSYVVKRRIVATKSIDPALYTGNTRGYQFFFVPDAVLADNTTTTITGEFFDEELLDDASHLLNLMTEVKNGDALIAYHGRLIVATEFNDGALVRVSYPGEPEAFDAVSGLFTIPPNDKAVINLAVTRDILYLYKIDQTFAAVDNGSYPASWPVTVIDNGAGAGLHGVATINEQESGTHTDYIMTLDLNGINLFTGTYIRPELSYKIWKFWTDDLLRPEKQFVCQILIDTLHKIVYINIPSHNMILFGDFANGLGPKEIRWGKWVFDIEPTTITLFDYIHETTLIIGSQT